MKKAILWLFAFVCPWLYSQTSVSGTITDTDSLAWANASVLISFSPTTACPQVPSGVPGVYKATANSSGAYSVTLPSICSGGASWVFQATAQTTPGVSVPSVYFSAPVAVSGATQTVNLTPPGPRFPAGAGLHGYGTIEVQPLPPLGTQMQIIPGNTCQWYTSSGWTTCSGGSGFTAAHDLSGTSTSQTVVGIQGMPVSSSTPTTGYALIWNGSAYAPTAVTATAGGSSGNIQVNAGGVLGAATPFDIGGGVSDSNGNYIFSRTAPTQWPYVTGFANDIVIGGAASLLGSSGSVTATTGAIVIGNQYTLQNAVCLNGGIAIGIGANQGYRCQNTGGEDGNFVTIGPFAANSATNDFESQAIGNKACEYALIINTVNCIGTHIYTGDGTAASTLVNSNVLGGNNGVSTAGVGISMTDVNILGTKDVNPPANSLTNPVAGSYAMTDVMIIGDLSGAMLMNGSSIIVIGDRSFNGPSGGTLITGINDISIGHSIYRNAASSSYTICIGGTPSGGSPTCNALTSGNNNTVVGVGAYYTASTATDASVFGYGAAALANATIDAFGYFACNKATGTLNACFGYLSGDTLTSGVGNTLLGNQAGTSITTVNNVTLVGSDSGLNENAASDTGVGASAIRRNTTTLGSITAVGQQAMFSNSGTGAEQYDAALGDNTNCNGCTYAEMIGHAAIVGAVAHAAEIGPGTNSTANTAAFEGKIFADNTGKLYESQCISAASPAVCGANSTGFVVVAASATTVVVDSTSVTANSTIQLTFDSSLGTALSVTCNTTPVQGTVSARTAGTSFTITVPSAPTTNPACFSYQIIN